jgi:hypothetical protein
MRNTFYNRLGMVKKRPAASVRSALNTGLGARRRFYPGSADCPEAGRTISFQNCLHCPKFGVWSPQDGDFRRCWHEYKDLGARGHYDGTWQDHPENYDPETFARIQERKRLNEEFAADFEREKAEMARLAEELEKKLPPSFFYEDFDLEDGDEDDDDGEAQPCGHDGEDDEY